MGRLRADKITGLGGANAIKGSVFFGSDDESNYNENLAITNTSDLDIGAGNYTIEYWFNCDDTTSDGFNTSIALSEYTNNSSNSALNIYHYNKGFRIFNRTGGGFVELSNPTDKWIPSRWHHFAWVRSGTGTNENAIYVDGVSIDTFTNAVNYTSGQHWLIGANFYTGSNGYGVNPEYGFAGYISNVRVSNVARYSGAFTPPTAEYTADSNTIILACQSPSNILQEATGKEVTFYKGYIASSPPQASRFTPNSPVGFSTTSDVGSQYGSTFDGFGSFATSTYMVPPGGNTRERNRGRAVFGGGESPTADNVMEYLNIQSGGRTVDFGDHSAGGTPSGDAVASSTRGVFTVHASPNTNALEFITIANTGNSQDFGDQTSGGVSQEAAASNSTRGLFAGGIFPGSTVHDVTEYITIATLGNAIDFGNLIASVTSNTGVADATRALFAGGIGPSSPFPTVNRIEYFTIANTGNATDFGDLTFSARYPGSAGDSTRGVFMGGATPSAINTICFVTIQTTGDATDYGDLVTASHDIAATSNNTRAIMGGGGTPSRTNTIEQLTIQTNGNATDFGDLSRQVDQLGVCSDSHGGL